MIRYQPVKAPLLLSFIIALSSCATSVAHNQSPQLQLTTHKKVETYTDIYLGFSVLIPTGWSALPRVRLPNGDIMNILLIHEKSQAQVVLHVIPKIKEGREVCQDIYNDMTTRLLNGQFPKLGKNLEEIETENIPATFFDFSAPNGRSGYVAVAEPEDRLFILISSWPDTTHPEQVDQAWSILRSLKYMPLVL